LPRSGWEEDRGIWSAGEREYAAKLLRDPTDFLDYTVDRNPHKHGRFLPGTHVPIFSPERILDTKPDFSADSSVEFEGRNHPAERVYSGVGGKFVVPIPEVQVYA